MFKSHVDLSEMILASECILNFTSNLTLKCDNWLNMGVGFLAHSGRKMWVATLIRFFRDEIQNWFTFYSDTQHLKRQRVQI